MINLVLLYLMLSAGVVCNVVAACALVKFCRECRDPGNATIDGDLLLMTLAILMLDFVAVVFVTKGGQG